MTSALRVLLVSAALALGACADMQTGAPDTATVASTPSPHAGCTQQTATIYFSDEVQSDQPVAMPLLNTLMDQVHACEHAGGELRGITISASADAGQTPTAATAQIQRRQERVRDALVHLGAPANKIRFVPAGTASAEAIMSKRADVIADLY
jgi:hypothetical protein